LTLFSILLGIGGTYWGAVWARSKHVTYYVSEPLSLIGPRQPTLHGLEVVTPKGVVRNPIFVRVDLKNTGAREVLASDWEEPVAITFEGIAGVATVGWSPVDRCEAINFDPRGRKSSPDATIRPNNLNSRESLTVAFLLDGVPKRVTVAGRIIGQTSRGLKSRLDREKRRAA
jgi:hypothetical protein